MNHYHEPSRNIPIIGEYDVIVCGGGPAGCAAAIGAARRGAKTILLESGGYLGGSPCTQLISVMLSTNAVDLQGIWHEWAAKLLQYDGIQNLHRRRKHESGALIYSTIPDPERIKVVWDELVDSAGAEILHFAPVVETIVRDRVIEGVLIETKGGRGAVIGKRVIDCTGDGDVCARAGASFDQGAGGKPWAMAAAMVAYYGHCGSLEEKGNLGPGMWAYYGSCEGRYSNPVLNGVLFRAKFISMLRVDPTDPRSLSQAMRQGRSKMWSEFLENTRKPGGEKLFLAATADQMAVRSSRRIRGLATALADDAMMLRKYPDGIARSSWEIDIHSPEVDSGDSIPFDELAYQERTRKIEQGDYFDIRYGCLVVKDIDNLLVAGRCLSAELSAQASLRIQQTCMSTGQAAGVAAAISIQNNQTPRELPASRVTEALESDRKEVAPAFDVLREIPIAPRIFS
ncbi:MAG: FAD-dependent oxidoreductase [Planctomycetes bacterium]|nr:FAD-dependent oxidoreductase [Planctomycetota bacterium]